MFSFHWDELKNSNSETERARPTQFVGVPKMALHDNSWNFPFKFDSVPVLPVSWKFYVEIPGKINGHMPWVSGIFKTREWVGGSKLFSNSVLLLVKLKTSLAAFRSAASAYLPGHLTWGAGSLKWGAQKLASCACDSKFTTVWTMTDLLANEPADLSKTGAPDLMIEDAKA